MGFSALCSHSGRSAGARVHRARLALHALYHIRPCCFNVMCQADSVRRGSGGGCDPQRGSEGPPHDTIRRRGYAPTQTHTHRQADGRPRGHSDVNITLRSPPLKPLNGISSLQPRCSTESRSLFFDTFLLERVMLSIIPLGLGRTALHSYLSYV